MKAVIFFAKPDNNGNEFERYCEYLRSNAVEAIASRIKFYPKKNPDTPEPPVEIDLLVAPLKGSYVIIATRVKSLEIEKSLIEEILKVIADAKSKIDKVTVFAHLGGGQIEKDDEKLGEWLKDSGCTTYALSTTIADSRLDVRGNGPIHVPTTSEELDELLEKCKAPVLPAEIEIKLDRGLDNKELPIVICADRERLKAEGVTAPYEFIVETEIKDKTSEKVTQLQDEALDKAIKNRRDSLKKFHGDGFTVGNGQLQDWFAGLFRRYLLLDTTAHGHEGFVSADDPSDVILNDCVKDPQKREAKLLRQRFLDEDFGEYDPLQMYKELLKCIYGKRFDAIKAALQDQNNAIAELLKIYTDRDHEAVPHKDRLPRAYGDRAKFVTPTEKLNLLLIDDHVEESPLAHLTEKYDAAKYGATICADDWKLLGEIFSVETLQIDNPRKVASEIRQKLGPENSNGFTYDLILVDLCLGPSGDLSGYSAIQLIHMYRPGVPVVVYSRFRDMEHITRALNEGAKWFLVKGEEAKLPRHVLKLLKQPGWHKEWNSLDLRPQFTCDDGVFLKKFLDKPEWQYLTYKVLNRFPGTEIHIKKMGGGISNATTFRAEKGEKDENGRFLQTPHIVKIDKEHAMRMEYERYTRFIRPYMANESGRVEQPERVINREAAAIVYTFAGKQDDAHVLESMGSMLKDDLMSRSACDFNKYREALDWIFDDILPKIHKVKLNDAHTSYPNALFGEVPPGEWLNNYRARMVPTQRVVITKDFVCQNDDSKPKFHWEFHDTAGDPERKGMKCLEVYDKNKNVVLFAGDRCDFIARFRRRLMPGMTLWLPDNPCNGSDNGGYESPWLNRVLGKNGNTPFGFFDIVTKLLGKSPFETSPKDLMDVYAELRSSLEEKATGCSCPTGIVHGDLNLNNIMLEARKHAPKESDRDVNKTVSDVWFIDFARTRRDIVAHDFNVFFTSTLGLLFDRSLIKKYNEFFDPKSGRSYFDKVASVFAVFVREAVSSKSKDLKAVPDEIADDPRLVLVYRILRRSREAALKYMSEKTYMLTTALACLGAMKIFIKKKDYLEMAAAYFAAAKIIAWGVAE